MKFIETDGGRKAAGFKGTTGDCVTRALAIATGEPYKQVYNELFEIAKEHAATEKDSLAAHLNHHGCTPRRGVNKIIYTKFLRKRGFGWITNQEGELTDEYFEKKPGLYIVQITKHLTVVKNGTLLDSWDCSKSDRKKFYGYFKKLK